MSQSPSPTTTKIMSHALLIVALSPEDLNKLDYSDTAETADKKDSLVKLHAAIQHQMAPFYEGNEWFADGSRWDWWVVGGRYSGRFPGGRDIVQRGELTEEAILAHKETQARDGWARWMQEPEDRRADEFTRNFLYGYAPDETEATLIAKYKAKKLSAFAFLKDRRWCESGRLGWFGTTIATECERKAAKDGEDYEGRCLFKHEESGAEIVTWEEGDSWGEKYWDRFIKPLPADYTLVAVDYHV